jgi:hypothetical protein
MQDGLSLQRRNKRMARQAFPAKAARPASVHDLNVSRGAAAPSWHRMDLAAAHIGREVAQIIRHGRSSLEASPSNPRSSSV